MSTIDTTDVARALANQLTSKRVPGSDPSHGGNLHITGPEERDFIRNSLDFDDQDNEAYIQWCIDFRNAQRSLWDRERFPIEESIMSEKICVSWPARVQMNASGVIKRKEIERYRRERKEEQEVKEEQELKEEQERKEEPKA
ncbi:hypothetical protein BT96DRAFT_943483 [Gymnopus androsaceus JB14]|uniref:Uncharacterized protein n=1 Tax=Gymnopus androsaceus JB14 TaxID=1447944 RepID=A0A6A4H7A6_9AGAR|nr:hypothetical protein BT96DRAFT_943483 [Gymnopus androsaceus JB14]